MTASKRRYRQVWLLPAVSLAFLLFLLPFLTVNHLPNDSKLHQQLSTSFGKHDVAAPQPDGSFNGVPLYYKETPTYSSAHCIGETFQEKHAWIHRSCHYHHLCFDLIEQEFVLFQSPQDASLQKTLRRSNKLVHIPTLLSKDQSVAIGGINTKWTWRRGIPRVKWHPRIITTPPTSYYEMSNTTWVPFHSMAGFNPGHLVWDDWLPIYTLLGMFQLLSANNNNNDSSSMLLLMRYVLPGTGMWATCDFNDFNKEACRSMFEKFLPLMGVTTKFTTNRDFELHENVANRTKYVCAKQGVAGIGMLTDHGRKLHGWEEHDYEYSHNHGRAKLLFDFRQFLVQNVLGSSAPPETVQGPPYKITFSLKSSKSDVRGLDFDKQIKVVQSSFPKELVDIQAYELKTLSLEEQVRVAAETAIFITVCGGGAVTATFLPRGASILLYFDATGGAKDNVGTGKPARLDWDIFNNAAHLRAHWLPTATMDSGKNLKLLVEIVRHELEILQQQNNNAR